MPTAIPRSLEGQLYVLEVPDDRIAHRLIRPVCIDAEIDRGSFRLPRRACLAQRLLGIFLAPVVLERPEAVIEMLEHAADRQPLAKDDPRLFRLQVLAHEARWNVRIVSEHRLHAVIAQRPNLRHIEPRRRIGDERKR
jgi:hypothetical protein